MNSKTQNKKKNKTATSSFGVSGRFGHDSTKFYNIKLYSHIKSETDNTSPIQKIDNNNLNKLYCKSSEKMTELPDNSIHLMVTSPRYNVTKELVLMLRI